MKRDESEEIGLARQLRRLLQAIEASGRAILPSSNAELLQSIVDAAARIFGAAAASISLVDEEQQALVFKVAYGVGHDDIVGMRIPVDKGIAGYVAMTGQPIAISDVQQDPRFLQEFAKGTGYVPRSILATPLVSGGRVIGVMEVLDKINAPSFGMQDMELLGVFAQQAAIAINQSQQIEALGQALVRGIDSLSAEDAGSGPTALAQALRAAPDAEEAPYRDLMEIAGILYALSSVGEAERRACLQILSAFADYLHSRPALH